MAKIILPGAAIRDEASFHAACRAAFGFPASYGNSMDALVDGLSYLRDEESLSSIRLGEKDVLEIVVSDSAAWRAAAPDTLEEFVYLVGAINERYEDYGEAQALMLSLA